MNWVWLSLLTAFLSATESTVEKRLLSDMSAWEMGSYPLLYSAPVFACIVAATGVPETAPGFWPTMLALLPFNMLGYALHMRSIQVSPLSLTMPFLAFTPVFAIFTGILILGERPNIWGVLGVLTLTAGGYILNLKPGMRGFLEPIRAVARERGSLYMLAAALIYSVTGVLGKKTVLQSTPVYSASMFMLLMTAMYVPAALAVGKVRPAALLRRPAAGVMSAGLLVAHILCHYHAVAVGNAAYMLGIKRLNGVFAVIYGRFVFGETDTLIRLGGTLLMTVGTALIAFWG